MCISTLCIRQTYNLQLTIRLGRPHIPLHPLNTEKNPPPPPTPIRPPSTSAFIPSPQSPLPSLSHSPKTFKYIIAHNPVPPSHAKTTLRRAPASIPSTKKLALQSTATR